MFDSNFGCERVCVCKRGRMRVHIYRVSHLCDRIGKITSEANVQIGIPPAALGGPR